MNYFELKYNLRTLYDRLEYKELTGNQIISYIREEIPFSECSINPVYTISMEDFQYDITGCYYAHLDQQGLPCIEIELLLPKMRTHYEICEDDLDRRLWNGIIFDLICVLGHEYVHLHQSRRRHFNAGKEYKSSTKDIKLKEHQEYLGTPDEVDAYSFSAAAQMAYFLPKIIYLEDTNVYKWYHACFKKNDTVIKLFEKKSMKYYNKLKRQYNETTKQRSKSG